MRTGLNRKSEWPTSIRVGAVVAPRLKEASTRRSEGVQIERQRQPVGRGSSVMANLGRFHVTADDLAERLGRVPGDHEFELGEVSRWLSGTRPSAARTWHIGEALRFADATSPDMRQAFMPSASGLLALHWYGYYADFVGVLASADAARLGAYAVRIVAMTQIVETTAITSEYDALSPTHAMLTGGADRQELRRIADTATHKISTWKDFEREALILNARAKARDLWHLEAGLHQVLVDAGAAWFGSIPTLKAGGKGRSEDDAARAIETARQAAIIRDTVKPLRYAHSVAQSNLKDDVKRYVLADLLTHWGWVLQHPTASESSWDAAEKALVAQGDLINVAVHRAAMNAYDSGIDLAEESTDLSVAPSVEFPNPDGS